MKKISTLNYKLESGKQVNITITRVYGNEQVAKECDGYKYTETEFKNDTTVSIPLKNTLFICIFSSSLLFI